MHCTSFSFLPKSFGVLCSKHQLGSPASWSWWDNEGILPAQLLHAALDLQSPSQLGLTDWQTVGKDGIGQSFSYFTYLSYWGLAFYFFFASMHTFVFARRGYTWLDRWPRPLQLAHTLYYTTVVCFPFLVSGVFWCTMFVSWFKDDFSQWSNISIHAMNSVFALLEIILPQTRPMPWEHLAVLLVILSLYLPIAYITKATESIYIYLWLNPKVGAGKIVAHVVGFAIVMVFIFNVVKLIIWFRCQITEEAVFYKPDQTDVEKGHSTQDWRIPPLDLQQPTVALPGVDAFNTQTEAASRATAYLSRCRTGDIAKPEPTRPNSGRPHRFPSLHARKFTIPRRPVPKQPASSHPSTLYTTLSNGRYLPIGNEEH